MSFEGSMLCAGPRARPVWPLVESSPCKVADSPAVQVAKIEPAPSVLMKT